MNTTLSPEITALVEMFRAQIKIPRTLAENRIWMDSWEHQAILPAGLIITSIDIDGIGADWLHIGDQQPRRTILYLHGGAFSTGSSKSHRPLTAHLAFHAQASVLCLNYRLAPEHRFPAALNDAISAYQYLLAQGILPSEIAIAGDSAGGGLAVATLLALRDQKLPLPAACATLSGWFDLACESESYVSNAEIDPLGDRKGLRFAARGYVNSNEEMKAPLASPVYCENFKGICPLLLQVGSIEVFRDDSVRLAALAQHDNVDVTLDIWTGMIHVWHNFVGTLPESTKALQQVGAWLIAKWQKK